MRSVAPHRVSLLLTVALTVTALLPAGSVAAAERSSVPEVSFLTEVLNWITYWLPNALPEPERNRHEGATTVTGPCYTASLDPNGICAQSAPPPFPRATEASASHR